MTVKWDGPAIICGTNPENGKFFVGTKSVFNKTPKINYSISDIRKNHGTTGAGAKLIYCFNYLKRLPIKVSYKVTYYLQTIKQMLRLTVKL